MLLERADEGTNAAVVFLVAASESQRLATLLTRRAQETLGPESSADILAARQAEFRTDLAKSIEVGTFLRQLGRKEESAVSRVQDFFHQAPPWSRASASSDSRENPALDNAARKRLQYFLRASSAAPGRGGHEQPQETDVGAALDAFDGAVELVSDGKRLDLSKMLHLLAAEKWAEVGAAAAPPSSHFAPPPRRGRAQPPQLRVRLVDFHSGSLIAGKQWTGQPLPSIIRMSSSGSKESHPQDFVWKEVEKFPDELEVDMVVAPVSAQEEGTSKGATLLVYANLLFPTVATLGGMVLSAPALQSEREQKLGPLAARAPAGADAEADEPPVSRAGWILDQKKGLGTIIGHLLKYIPAFAEEYRWLRGVGARQRRRDVPAVRAMTELLTVGEALR